MRTAATGNLSTISRVPTVTSCGLPRLTSYPSKQEFSRPAPNLFDVVDHQCYGHRQQGGLFDVVETRDGSTAARSPKFLNHTDGQTVRKAQKRGRWFRKRKQRMRRLGSFAWRDRAEAHEGCVNF